MRDTFIDQKAFFIKEIAELRDLIQKMGVKLDFTSEESGQALKELNELKKRLDGEKSVSTRSPDCNSPDERCNSSADSTPSEPIIEKFMDKYKEEWDKLGEANGDAYDESCGFSEKESEPSETGLTIYEQLYREERKELITEFLEDIDSFYEYEYGETYWLDKCKKKWEERLK